MAGVEQPAARPRRDSFNRFDPVLREVSIDIGYVFTNGSILAGRISGTAAADDLVQCQGEPEKKPVTTSMVLSRRAG